MDRSHQGLSAETKRYIKEQITKRLRYFPRAPSPAPVASAQPIKRKRRRFARTYESEVRRLRLPTDVSTDLMSLDLRREIATTAVQISESRKQIRAFSKRHKLTKLSSSLNRLMT